MFCQSLTIVWFCPNMTEIRSLSLLPSPVCAFMSIYPCSHFMLPVCFLLCVAYVCQHVLCWLLVFSYLIASPRVLYQSTIPQNNLHIFDLLCSPYFFWHGSMVFTRCHVLLNVTTHNALLLLKWQTPDHICRFLVLEDVRVYWNKIKLGNKQRGTIPFSSCFLYDYLFVN